MAYDGYRRGYVSFAHFLLYLLLYQYFLVISGNEGEGLPAEILDQCNINIHIKPQNAQHLDSLNVSVATGN